MTGSLSSNFYPVALCTRHLPKPNQMALIFSTHRKRNQALGPRQVDESCKEVVPGAVKRHCNIVPVVQTGALESVAESGGSGVWGLPFCH